MGPAGRQLGALLWKDWLCRCRHPVSEAACPRALGVGPRGGSSGWALGAAGAAPHPAGHGEAWSLGAKAAEPRDQSETGCGIVRKELIQKNSL